MTGELSQQGSKRKEERAVLQKSISALDREKDALQDEVDQKTEKLVVLQEENSKKVFTASKLHQDHQAFIKGQINIFVHVKRIFICTYVY